MMPDQSADALVASLPIVDAHHHVWDVGLGAHPWLTAAPLASFRYGDYRAIRRTYLPADYRRDTARFNVVKTDAAAELARDFPATTIILNHTGLPADRSAEGLAGWRRAMQLLAREANVVVKISGLGVPGQRWTAELQGPVVRDAIAMFGSERAMFASNYPVDSLVATFDEIYGGFLEITRDLPETVRCRLFHDNAARIYRL